jgi:hypothetical protein
VKRFGGTCEPLCGLDASRLSNWIREIPLAAWPQQNRLSVDYPYPAMVADLEWQGFGEIVSSCVEALMQFFEGGVPTHRMLSIVIPGQRIARHDDVQGENWRCRVHVPLVTNPGAVMFFDDESFHMEVGTAYRVNTEVPHSLHNLGSEPRIHLFFDVIEN